MILLYISTKNTKSYINPYFFGAKNNFSALFSDKPNKQIQSYLENQISNFPGSYGVFIKDLKHQTIYSVNENQTFQTASIYKLAVLYKTYDAISKGEIKKDDVLSEDEYTLDQVLAPDDENTANGIVTYKVSEALNSMITVSDNYAALLLAHKLGWDNIDSFLHQQNISGFDLSAPQQPVASPRAVSQILEKIHNGTAVDAQSSQEMRDLLLDQTINDKIPKYLPPRTKIAHKTGELDNIRNDAAIIYGRNSTYIFVILSEAPVPEEATENIANLSKNMYEKLEAN